MTSTAACANTGIARSYAQVGQPLSDATAEHAFQVRPESPAQAERLTALKQNRVIAVVPGSQLPYPVDVDDG